MFENRLLFNNINYTYFFLSDINNNIYFRQTISKPISSHNRTIYQSELHKFISFEQYLMFLEVLRNIKKNKIQIIKLQKTKFRNNNFYLYINDDHNSFQLLLKFKTKELVYKYNQEFYNFSGRSYMKNILFIKDVEINNKKEINNLLNKIGGY